MSAPRVNAARSFSYAVMLTRPHNCFIAALSVAVGAFLASHGFPHRSVAAAIMACFVCAGAYALNDFFDVATDKVAKPWRPLASGHLRPGLALRLAIGLWAVAGGFAVLGGKETLGFYGAWVLLVWAYSWKLKGRGLYGHILVSGVASSGFILGAASAGDLKAGILPASVATVIHLAREIAKSTADLKGDTAAGIRTVAVRIGGRSAMILSLWCIGGAVLLSLLPFVRKIYGLPYFLPVAVVIYPILGICIRRIMLARRKNQDLEAAARSVAVMLKFAMIVGLLAFLLAGI